MGKKKISETAKETAIYGRQICVFVSEFGFHPPLQEI